jgi:hypothetical protein
MYNSVTAPQVGGVGAQSSVVYPLGKVQPLAEIMKQMNQLKLAFANLKMGFNDLMMSQNEMRMDHSDLQGQFTEHLTKNGCGKKRPKKNER